MGGKCNKRMRKKEKSPVKQTTRFLYFFEGGDREWFSSIRDLLYPRNVCKVCIVSKRNRKFLNRLLTEDVQIRMKRKCLLFRFVLNVNACCPGIFGNIKEI